MSEAILDAGPLIHLAELDALDVLSDFTSLYVPDAVWDEVTNYQSRALEHPKLKIKRLNASISSIALMALAQALTLDKGEIEALALLEGNPQALFLTDDTAARLAAIQRGYTVHGKIGLLVRSVRQGLRTHQEVLALLNGLPQHSTLHIRPQLLDAIIKQLQDEWS